MNHKVQLGNARADFKGVFRGKCGKRPVSSKSPLSYTEKTNMFLLLSVNLISSFRSILCLSSSEFSQVLRYYRASLFVLLVAGGSKNFQ